MKNIPSKIFLNLGEDLECFEDFNDLGEVTWCENEVGDGDIEYQRKLIWHNLSKNPKDLPKKDYDVVIVCVKRESGHTESLTGYYDGNGWWVDEEGKNPNVIAWMDFPKFK